MGMETCKNLSLPSINELSNKYLTSLYGSLSSYDSNNLTCSSGLLSKVNAEGRPSRVEKRTLPPESGEMSEYSLVQRARVSAPNSAALCS